MKTKSKTEIIVETHRILTIKGGSGYRLARCEACGGQVQMATADQAAILARVSSRVIYQLIEAREIHFIETSSRMVLICLNSLAK